MTLLDSYSRLHSTSVVAVKSKKSKMIRDNKQVEVKVTDKSSTSLINVERTKSRAEVEGQVITKPEAIAKAIAKEHTKCQPKQTTKEKNKILDQYESTFGVGTVANAQGKSIQQLYHHLRHSIPSRREIAKQSKMKPSLKKQYRVSDLDLYNVIAIVMRVMGHKLEATDYLHLSMVNKEFQVIIPEFLRLLALDFSPLLEPRYDYQQQEEISEHRVDMAGALLVHFGLDPGMAVRCLGLEYTGANRDVESTLRIIKPHVNKEDHDHIERILTQGCPVEFNVEESTESKLEIMNRGNQTAFENKTEEVKKIMNKEDKFSHVITLRKYIARCSPFMRCTSQIIVQKAGKDDRVAWNGTGKWKADDFAMNDVTPTEEEAPVTFGSTWRDFLVWLYNMRVSFPHSDILLGMADIKACFRYPRIAPDLVGAFGYQAIDLYFLATAMVFGSTVSANGWEPFRRAIEAMTKVYFETEGLVQKHAIYLDMIEWKTDCPTDITFTRAKACPINPGIINSDGTMKPLRAKIYVDDALMAAMGIEFMKRLLAAVIEAIFVVMGEPDESVRQNHLAMNKWRETVISPQDIMLGIQVKTRALAVAVTTDYRHETLALITTAWHPRRRTFTAQQAQELVGKLGRLSSGAHWVFHIMSHIYTSIAYALRSNRVYLHGASSEFKELLENIERKKYAKSDNSAKHINFALKQLARSVHHCKVEYVIPPTMLAEIAFFREALPDNSGVEWETPIALIIPRTPVAVQYGDSCLEGCGGYSLKLRFWWHLEFPIEVVLRTLIHKRNNDDGKLISINVLEFLTVIINYAAAYTALIQDPIEDDPNPVVLNITDNTSALNWTLHGCKKSMIGRRLARFFCGLLIGSHVGINSEWIGTQENEIADAISRLKQESKISPTDHVTFDYSNLQQQFPQLKDCRFFQPSQELLSSLWEILLTEKFPSLKQIAQLKRNGLGKLIG